MQKEEAVDKLKRQLNMDPALKFAGTFSPQFAKWQRDTEVAIEHIFGLETRHLGDFRSISYTLPGISHATTRADHETAYKKGLTKAKAILQSFIDEIEEYGLSKAVSEGEQDLAKRGSDVFIVHGHDLATKHAVARFIEQLGLKPIILHEQPNQGRTVIEKFEDYAHVGFAVVLLTPDDVGAAAGEEAYLKPRARQNVILELGFFMAKLGRNRVCALYKESVEIPSDYEGVLYISMEAGWQLLLAKELKAAGIAVDLNKL